jgi:hypothetical protein
MHWRTLIEKDYLGAWNLVDKADKPKDYTLQIAKVEGVKLKTAQTPKGKGKAVITFARAEKKFVANTTNCKVIAAMYGDDIEGWIGKKITLYMGDVRNPDGGGTIKGIKVRPKIPGGAAEAIEAAQPVDEEMRGAQNAAFGRGEDAPAREPGEEG